MTATSPRPPSEQAAASDRAWERGPQPVSADGQVLTPSGRSGSSAAGIAVRASLLAGGFVVLGLWIVAADDRRNLAGTANALLAIGRVSGFTCAYVALVQVLLMARVPWFERAVGFDRLLTWHKALGTSTVFFLGAHIALVVWGSSLVGDRSITGELWSAVSTYPAMLRGTASAVLFVVVAATSGRLARRHLRFELWWALHLTSYLAVALSFAHQVEAGTDFVAHPWAATAWRLVFLLVFAAVAWWRLARPLERAYALSTRVTAVVPEAGGAVSVFIGGDAMHELHAPAGSYVLVRFLRRGLWSAARPYSLSAPFDGDGLRITVSGSRATSVAALVPGTRAVIEGPFGLFTAAAGRPSAPALLIGGGAGIAPIRAIAEELSVASDVVVIQLDASTSPLGAELAAAAAHGHIAFHELGSPTELGHDPLEPLRLGVLVPDVAQRDVWVCGPEDVVRAVVAACTSMGVPPDHLHVESFDR